MNNTLVKRSTAVVLLLFSCGIGLAQTPPTQQDLQQLVAKLQSDPANNDLREKIIKTAATMSPRPTTPDEARKHMVRGQLAFKAATTQADFQKAVDEFQQAVNVAPWFGEAYFNLAVAQKGAGLLKPAIQNLDLFFLTGPSEEVGLKGKDLKYEIEYKQEEADRQAAAQQAQQAQQAAAERAKASNPIGHWYSLNGGNYVEFLVITPGPSGGFYVVLSQQPSMRLDNLSFDGKTLRWTEDWFNANRNAEFTISPDGNTMQGTWGVWQSPTPAQIQAQEAANRRTGRRGSFDYSNVGKGLSLTLYRR